jgi:hypothetical protein
VTSRARICGSELFALEPVRDPTLELGTCGGSRGSRLGWAPTIGVRAARDLTKVVAEPSDEAHMLRHYVEEEIWPTKEIYLSTAPRT